MGIPAHSVWMDGGRGRARTCNPQLRRLMLYPVELRARKHIMAHGDARYAVRMAGLIEIEVKIAVTSAARVRKILRDAKFSVICPRVFEQNLLLDNVRGSVKSSGLLLRVRTLGKRNIGQAALCIL